MRRIDWFKRLSSMRTVSAAGSVLAPIVDGRFVPHPHVMIWVVTQQCNSRCQMCSIWKRQDAPLVSVDEAEQIFARDDFSFVRSLTLTGGEPTLRSDLPQLFEVALRHSPNLEHLLLATNGLLPRRISKHVGQMLDILAERENRVYRFDVQISLDGVGEIHDTVRGIQGFFQQVEATIAELRELQPQYPLLNIRLSSVLMPLNLPHVEELRAFACRERLHIYFSPAILESEYYGNLGDAEDLSFSLDEEDARAREFFDKLAEEDETSMRFYYRDVAEMIQGRRRSRRCMMGFYGFTLEHDGSVYPCVNCERRSFGNLLDDSFEKAWFGAEADRVRRQLRASCCPTCTSACFPPPANALELAEVAWRQRFRSFRRRQT
jgi:MoaA/NifB/PqqE/SkfB family radical SAM enzyme